MTYNPKNWKKNNKDMDYNNSSRRLRPIRFNSRPHVWTAHRPFLKVQKDIRCKTRNNEIVPNIPWKRSWKLWHCSAPWCVQQKFNLTFLLSFPVFQGPLILPPYHGVSLVAAPRAMILETPISLLFRSSDSGCFIALHATVRRVK